MSQVETMSNSFRPVLALLVTLHVGIIATAISFYRTGESRIYETTHLVSTPLELPDMSALNSTPMPSVDVAGLRDQALFYASRSFYSPPPRPTEIAPPPFELAGTMRLPNGKRLAFVKGQSDQRQRTLHVGDDLEGWTVQSIEPERIALLRDEQVVSLTRTRSPISSGLIRAANSPKAVQTGIRILGVASRGDTFGRASVTPDRASNGAVYVSAQPRTFRPPTPLGK